MLELIGTESVEDISMKVVPTFINLVNRFSLIKFCFFTKMRSTIPNFSSSLSNLHHPPPLKSCFWPRKLMIVGTKFSSHLRSFARQHIFCLH